MATRILIVDDTREVLDTLQRGFAGAAEDVSVSSSFDDARRLLKQQRFDVLITDVRLGAYNGLHLAVLAREINPDLELVVFSGYDDPVLRHDAEQLGATYLLKPVTAGQLLALIRHQPR